MARSISTWCCGTPVDDGGEELLVGRRRQFREAMLDEFLRHFLGAAARHFHLVERLHRGQTGGMARVGLRILLLIAACPGARRR